ncbi:hypothetical protein G9409_11375 [Chlorobium sp. BLA1]|uniref:hypothetical protein n=1 Tax=Candidatus Chlorobium masyuteum TaxID=2716876 RepID=UPI00141E443E|nr:hypothetical protein [Candidatus Chlorobium masyuteum]NHQ61171.1 hypothetical protein [Candidatus Chlorobium masyuteum]
MTHLKLSLSENAISFAEDALSNAIVAEETPKRWKFAVLGLVQAIELSLKELLSHQHPFLIYKDVDKPNNTVGIELAASRLRTIVNIQLTSDESAALKTAVNIRNCIVHHQVDAAIANMKLNFARLLGFLNDFHRKHLGEALQDQIDDELWRAGVKIQDYGVELFRRAAERMKEDGINENVTIACPNCGWKALTPYEPHAETCYVCGHIESLAVCDRCQNIMLSGEEHEHSNKVCCCDCLCYITDDYWYEQSVGK